MGRLLCLGLVSALSFTIGGVGPAQADSGPHVSSAAGAKQTVGTYRCASCHRAHTADEAFPLSAGQDVLCFTCHGHGGNGASTDVIDGVGYGVGGTQNRDRSSAPGALRGGGFDYALIGSGEASRETYLSGTSLLIRNQVIPVLAAGMATTSNHPVKGAKVTAWGGRALNSGAGDAVTLECGSCHDPHGNGNYRILRRIPTDSGGSTSAVGVTIPDASVKVYTTTNYWLNGDAGSPSVVNGVNGGAATSDGYLGNIIQWCTNLPLAAPLGCQRHDGRAEARHLPRRSRFEREHERGGRLRSLTRIPSAPVRWVLCPTAAAHRLKNLLEPGSVWGDGRAPRYDRAHIDHDSLWGQRCQVELQERLGRLEDDNCRTEGQRRDDRLEVER